MAGEWRETTLGAFVALQRGHDLTESERKPGRIPVMGSAGQNGCHSTAIAPGPGVVIGRSGASFGKVHYCAQDYWPHNTALYVTDFRGNHPRFAFYFLGAIDFSRYNSGSAQPSLNRNYIYAIPVSFPDPGEQRAIAHILGTLDDKIELNRRMNETLEAMARTIFKSWFVDFDPVRAKLDGRQPERMDKATADLFPDSFEDSTLGKIPRGWKVASFSQHTTILSGGTPKTSVPEYWGGDIPWYTVKDAPADGDVWVLHTERKLTRAGIENSAADVFGEKTAIISARGTVGKLALTGVPMAMNQTCYGVKCRNDYSPLFTYFNLRAGIATLQQRSHGTVFDTITRETFARLDCCYPPPQLAQRYDKYSSPILDHIRANLRESAALAVLRDALLPKLLSGEIRVKDVERRIGETI